MYLEFVVMVRLMAGREHVRHMLRVAARLAAMAARHNSVLGIKKENRMPIWKLKPTDVSSRDWEASTYRGEVIIRAESEIKARQIAIRAFVIATQVRLGEKITDVPWNQSLLVSAVTTQDSTYQNIGSEEIVGPPEALRNAGA